MSIKKFLGLVCLSCFIMFVMDASAKSKEVNSVSPTNQEGLNVLPKKGSKTEEVLTKRERRGPLFDALASALKNNKEILAAQNEIKSVHESHVSATSAFRPRIGFESGYQADNKDYWTKGGTGDKSKARVKSYGFTVNQNLFNGFADVAALKEVDLGIKARWSSYEAKKQSVLAEVSITYFRIIAKKEEIRHLKALLDARKESIGVAEEMYKTGAAKYLDLSQANASYAETEAKLASAEADYIAQCAKFEEDTGYKIPEVLSYPEKLFDESMTEQQALDIATKYNPSVIAAIDTLAASKAGVKKINTEFTPSLNAQYRFDQSYNHSGRNRSPNDNKLNTRGHTVALTLSVPIYDGGKSRAEKRQSIEQATKSAVDKEKVILDVKSQIYAVWAALRAAKQSLASAESAVQARELALHDTEEEYKAGVKIIKDVLDAQEQLFEAKSMKTNAENEYFSNQCRAIALIGRMTSHYLMIPGDGFDYKGHFGRTKSKI